MSPLSTQSNMTRVLPEGEVPSETSQGNTSKPGSRASVGKRWVFTLFMTPDVNEVTLSNLSTIFDRDGSKYIVGLEHAPSTGRPHIQGYVSHTKAFRPMEKYREPTQGAHWEKAKGNEWQNFQYCSKGGNYRTNITIQQVIDPMVGLTPYPWQQAVLDMIERPPNPRQINWIWEQVGNRGKTTFAKHICMTRNAIYVSGKADDVKYAVQKYIEKRGHGPNIVIFAFPRTVDPNMVSYSALESVKDGIFFSGKYESEMVIFNIPHVFVLANFEPEYSRLSEDRWNIINI